MSAATVAMEIDCHAYAWHEPDEANGHDGDLVRMAEEFGVLIRFLPDHPAADWAWWYEISGPRENLVELLAMEYCGDDEQAREMVDGTMEARS